jgi:hypothetical protein
MSSGVVRLTVVIYTALLIVYPQEFRREYGMQMVDVFETASADHVSQGGGRRLLHFWIHALWDLCVSGWAERLSGSRSGDAMARPWIYVGALVASLVTGYIHLRLDADQMSIILLLVSAYMCGLISPTAVWRWGLIIGLGTPAALIVAHGFDVTAFSRHDADMPLPTSLVPAYIGAYTGTLAHRLYPRLVGKASTVSSR